MNTNIRKIIIRTRNIDVFAKCTYRAVILIDGLIILTIGQ